MIASVSGLAPSAVDGLDDGREGAYVSLASRPGRNGTRKRAPYRCPCASCSAQQPARLVQALAERAQIFNQSERPRCAGCGAMRALADGLCHKCLARQPSAKED